MKHLKVAGLCLVSMLVMGMALAGNASAAKPALLWLLCLEEGTSGTAPTKYLSNQCTETNAGLTGKWQSSGLSCGTKCSDTVRLLAFSLILTDKGTGVSVHCPDVGIAWGLIESGKLIIKVAESKDPKGEGCTVTGSFLTCTGTSALTGLHAVNLPWTAELTETENKYLSTITKTTGGKPGWAVECGGATDTCEEETGKPELAFVGQGITKGVLLVLLSFENIVKAKCSIGGKEEGTVQGLIAILLWNGNGLSLTTL